MSPGTRSPKLRSLETTVRSVTPLELFFDLAFIASLRQIGATFGDDPTLARLFFSFALWTPMVWTWAQITVYGNRFDTDDPLHRTLKVLSMAGVAMMGISATAGDEDRSALFVLGFLVARALLLAMYARALRHVEGDVRDLARTYLVGYGVGAVLWASVLLLPAGVRAAAGLLLVLVEVGVPVVAWRRLPRRSVNRSHLAERFSLFTILVLGEGWLAVVSGAAETPLTSPVVAVTVAVFVAAVAVWWIYFDHAEASALEGHGGGLAYVYIHLVVFIVLGLATASAEVLVRDGDASEVTLGARVAYLIGAAVFALGIAALRLRAGTSTRAALIARGAVAVGLVAFGLLGGALNPPVLAAVVALHLLVLMGIEVLDRPPAEPQQDVAHAGATD
jgi:low temperature requirement protein LtrA